MMGMLDKLEEKIERKTLEHVTPLLNEVKEMKEILKEILKVVKNIKELLEDMSEED